MAKARITFTFNSVAYQLQSDYPELGARFHNWTPDSQPVGDFAHTLADETLHRFRTSWRYGVHFEIPGLGMGIYQTASALSIATKLRQHLLNGGTCAVFTEDLWGGSYATCGLMPGTVPQITLANRRAIEYSMALSLINLAASPVEMIALYHATTPLAYLMDASGGRYTFGTGAKPAEATAFLKDGGAGSFSLDSSAVEEDRLLYYVVFPDESTLVV